ncbi:MAG: TraB/GumN family protein [Euryarchaeota archaeon]|nr:TraB/GumN family protein [Euryarchaeota archaeon]
MITLVGTAHISRESVAEVQRTIAELKPAVVAVELDEFRLRGMKEQHDVPVVDLIKRNNATVALINILLAFLQRRLGAEVGVKPGREMLAAIEMAKQVNARVALIDRDIRITMRRALAEMSLREKLNIARELLSSLFISGEEIKREIGEVKKEENLLNIITSMREFSPNLYRVLVKERDAYMAAKLLELERRHGSVLAVVGAGHKPGIERYLAEPEKIPPLKELEHIPRRRLTLGNFVKVAIPALVLGLFALALLRGVPIQGSLALWLANHMVPTFIAVLLARGSLAAAAAGALASPLTSLNPLIAAGWFAGFVEAKVKRVTVGEVSAMFKAASTGELFRNRAFRVLLVTAFANLGSMLGTAISFPTIILPLYQKIFGV